MKETGKEVERYLNRATRGLWGRKRQEIREELEGHISERVMAYRIAGLNEGYAVERALRGLGEPREVSAGMAQIYTVPWVAGSSMALAAICAVTIAAVSLGMAQTLQTAQTFPSPNCLESSNDTDQSCQGFGAWATFDALEDVLKPQGVEFIEKGDTLSLQFSDGKFATVFISSLTPLYFGDDETELSAEYQPKPGYFKVWDFLENLVKSSSLPIRVEGWNNPTVYIANTSFTLGNDEQPVDGQSFYLDYLTSTVLNPNQLLAASSRKNPNVFYLPGGSYEPSTLRLDDAEPDAVYGVVMLTTPQTVGLEPNTTSSGGSESEEELIYTLDVARAKSDSTLSLRLPTGEPLTFLGEFAGQPQRNTAVLVRLIGTSKSGIGFGYEVVPPEQISVLN